MKAIAFQPQPQVVCPAGRTSFGRSSSMGKRQSITLLYVPDGFLIQWMRILDYQVILALYEYFYILYMAFALLKDLAAQKVAE
jgi:hypothetical protein